MLVPSTVPHNDTAPVETDTSGSLALKAWQWRSARYSCSEAGAWLNSLRGSGPKYIAGQRWLRCFRQNHVGPEPFTRASGDMGIIKKLAMENIKWSFLI